MVLTKLKRFMLLTLKVISYSKRARCPTTRVLWFNFVPHQISYEL